MELKLRSGAERTEVLPSFNRTFMELKSVYLVGHISFKKVLIVPLWN